MNLSEIIDTSGVIADAFKQPALRIKARSAKRPDIDTAMKAVVNELEKQVMMAVAEEVQQKLEKEYVEFVDSYGDWDDQADKEEWEAMIDEMVETAITQWTPILSQDWLGEKTIGTSLHKPDGVKEFSMSLGKEYYKQLVHGKTPAQVMSSAGIIRKDIEAALAVHLQPTEKDKVMTEQQQTAEFTALIEKMATHLGKDPDNIMGICEDIDLASDDDDILAEGAAPRLGLDPEDIDTLRTERLMHGDDLADVITRAMEAYHEAPKKEKPKRATPAQKEEKAKVQASKRIAVSEAEVNAIPVVLTALKECGLKDDDMGKRLGVSRATYNNYATGKTVLQADEAQLSTIRGELVDRANKLLEALAALDGTEAHVVF